MIDCNKGQFNRFLNHASSVCSTVRSRLQHDLTIEQTLLAVEDEAHQESSEAMQLRSKAL
jgi:hypothetical protein